MNILEHLDKNNLHHAYLIEGSREEIKPKILEFCESLGIKTVGNPDFYNISIDNFKIDDAFYVRSLSQDKSFSDTKKIFLLSLNSASLDAQNVLLKMFEEPIFNTHFFLLVPDTHSLLKTLVSRFYFISTRSDLTANTENAEKFIKLPLKDRIDFIKSLLVEPDDVDDEGSPIILEDSPRSKSLIFLNSLEIVLHQRFQKNSSNSSLFHHLFYVREFLRMPGSSTKSLMESLALVIPNF